MHDGEAGQETAPGPVALREVDPFSFFVNHASAIEGFGGTENSPDPRYCFHTPYLEVRPGRAMFHVAMDDARATFGELTIRVHGFREGIDAVMVANSKLVLEGFNGLKLDHALQFTAIEGIRYALFAYFSEPSDIRVASIGIRLEEFDDRVAIPANLGALADGRAPSRFAAGTQVPSPRLIADKPPSFANPMSQPCTRAQIEDPRFTRSWPAVAASGEAPLRCWELAIGLQVLKRAGMLAAGAHGLLFDAPHRALVQELAGAGVIADEATLASAADPVTAADRWIEERGAQGTVDFVASYTMMARGAEAHLELIGAALRCLRAGGLGVFLMPYWGGDALRPRPAGTEACVDRNDLQKALLLLIGQSYAVTQIALPREARREATSFVFVVHRPGES